MSRRQIKGLSVVAAMRNLRASGDQSFEQLIALLLQRVSGERIRRSKAGTQGGVDAIAEIPFAIEDKRHTTKLESRNLVGGLTEAADTYPDLQLWVLVATCAVAAQTRDALVRAGSRQGIAVLILDTTSSELDLAGVANLAALAATDVDCVLDVLGDPAWRSRGRKPDLNLIRTELTEIRSLSGFGPWEARLRNDLRELPTWRYLVREQNNSVLSRIVGDAFNAFGTRYDPTEAVQRSAEAELTAWWESRNVGSREVAVVTGDLHDGKTWLVFGWLARNLRTFSVPAFFFWSEKVKSEHGDVEKLVREEARRALGRFERNTDAIINRQKSLPNRADPWCLVILDGANEYVSDFGARSEAILWADPPPSSNGVTEASRGLQPLPLPKDRRPALLVTWRARDFEEDRAALGSRPVQPVELGPYDDREFADALRRHSLSVSQLQDMPASALRMVRHPMYLKLAIEHWNELKSFGHITVPVLQYLDATDRVPLRRSSAARFDPGPFKEFLANLAAAWAKERRLNHSTLLTEVRAVTHQVDTALHALKSEGVIEYHPDGTLVPDLERLALGMGLYIRDKLLSVSDTAAWPGALAKILEPNRDDEKVRWLRVAVTVSLLAGDAERHPVVIDFLIAAWLSSRNFSQQDLDDLRNLSSLLLEPALRVLNSPAAANANIVLLAEPLIQAGLVRYEAIVVAAVRRWLRLVPLGSRWFIGGESKASDAVAEAAAEPSFSDLQLEITNVASGNAARKLQRLALSIACTHPFLLQPIDVLALFAARHAVGGYLDRGEQFAVRRVLADSDVSWFEQEVQAWAAKPETLRASLMRDLITATGRKDLLHLLKRLPTSTYRRWVDRSLTRAGLSALKPGDSEQIMADAERASDLALDPACLPPPRSWRTAFAKVALQRFGRPHQLHEFRSLSRDDYDFRRIEPVLAAWAPDAGARILRGFLADVLRLIEADEKPESWEMNGDATLLTLEDRRKLLAAVRAASPNDTHTRHALLQAYLCVLAGASSSQRLRLLLEHPFEVEWLDLYSVAAAARDSVFRRKAIAAGRVEQEPHRLTRARYMLGYFRPELTAKDLARLIGDLSPGGSGGDAENAARFLLTNSRITSSTPAEALGPLVHVASSLSEAAWQYEAFLGTTRRPGLYPADWVGKARSAPQTARHNGADENVSDEDAVAQGIELLAGQVQERLARSMKTPGRWEQFPDGIASEISESAFNAWVDQLRSSPDYSRRFYLGLLMPVIRHALRTRHPAAKELWAMAYPFQRGRFSPGDRYVSDGVDWTIREIHDPELDDELARDILRELVADCRSDSELVEVAMGARLESTSRLISVVEEGLGSKDEIDRARARLIAGWLPEKSISRRRLAAADRSQWVERVGQRAIRRLNRERWAKEGSGVFCLSRSRHVAGRPDVSFCRARTLPRLSGFERCSIGNRERPVLDVRRHNS